MFRNANPFDDVVVNATSETLTSENWDLILTICEKVNRSGDNSGRDCLGAIQKRLANKNANVILYSLTLCESLAKNCGLKAQREISSRAFTALLVKILNEKTTHPAVRQRILELIQQWAFEFRADPSLGIMDETYQQLRVQSKFKFPSPQKPKKELKSEADKRKEEEELQLALALSLSASEHSAARKSSSTTQQHPEVATAPVKRVRALYDFEPTESGELGFQKDDIIVVLATSYQDWWKGELFGRQGIFPVNYVEEIKEGQSDVAGGDDEAHVLQEAKNVDGLIQMLSSVDPRRDNFSDNETLQDTYNNVLGVRPKLVELIKKHGEKKDELLLLNEKLTRARAAYEKMMEQSIAKYSNPTYSHYQPQYQTTVHGQTNQQSAPFQSPQMQDPRMQQQQFSQPLVSGQQTQYAPYQPQQPSQGQNQQLTFDQAYAQSPIVQGQFAQEYNNTQAPVQQQQGLGQMQGYVQQPTLANQQIGYAPQHQVPADNQAAQFSQPTNGYSNQPQYAQ
ncbi:ESCRT-0 subunit protein hse1 [Podila humilis]|nr:ESCRT-0 subunit protein hse1 [Podila humilis]